ncbi:alpha/beta fold hydrolase [bacterium]|nr:alpha/beta fold hydrolase [bacterium]
MKHTFLVIAGGLLSCGCGAQAPVMTEPDRSDSPNAEQELRLELVEQDREIVLLQSQLTEANRELEAQRRLLREQALVESPKSVDEMLALFPAKFPQGPWQLAETTFEDCWFESLDGLRLHGWYLQHPKATEQILYLHGNAGNLSTTASAAVELYRRHQCSVLLFDYRGYGRSEGVPTIDGVLRDARAARNYLAIRSECTPQEIVLLGRSLGGAVAVQLAAEDGARALILESTFSSLRDVADEHYPQWLVRTVVADRLNSEVTIKRYVGPLLMSHGDHDTLISIESARRLFAAANPPKQFFVIEGSNHNDAPTDHYHSQLSRFLANLPLKP